MSGGPLHIQIDGTVRGAVDALSAWPLLPPLPTYGRDRDGARAARRKALIFVTEAHHVSIAGRGTIEGQGAWWWSRRHTLGRQAGRPHLVEIHNSSYVSISGLTLRNSPFWTLHAYCTEHLHVHHLTIRAPLYAPNTDGVDPDSCRHVLIEHCDISVGDDHIAIKSGMNAVARDGFPRFVTENVTVRYNTLRTGMGVTVGSETAGGIRGVAIRHNVFTGMHEHFSVALHVKSASQRGGVVEDVVFEGNTVWNTSAFMRLDAFGTSVAPVGYQPAVIRRIIWRNNTYDAPEGRRVRSKFVCPEGGSRCSELVVEDNRAPAGSRWQCRDVARDFRVHRNRPAGLSSCLRLSSSHHRAKKHRGGRAGRRGPRAIKTRSDKVEQKERHPRWRKFDWRTGSSSWSDT